MMTKQGPNASRPDGWEPMRRGKKRGLKTTPGQEVRRGCESVIGFLVVTAALVLVALAVAYVFGKVLP